ncbi:MAG: hypothetical protein Q9208_001251 [Pyrenodesmia sp. 3 TL-2023]
MAGISTHDGFEKALGALEILADVYATLKAGEGSDVYKLVNREIESMLKAGRDSLTSKRALNYLHRVATVRTSLDARKMIYDTKGMNDLVMCLVSAMQAPPEKVVQKEVSSTYKIPETPPTPQKRALSATGASPEAGLEKQGLTAMGALSEETGKKQKLTPEKNKSWTVKIESYVTKGELHKRIGSEHFVFGWDQRWKKFIIRRGYTECLHLPKEAAGVVAIYFHSCNTIHNDHYVRLTPTVSRHLTDPEHGVVHLKLANTGAAQALEKHMQPMDNAIFHSVERTTVYHYIKIFTHEYWLATASPISILRTPSYSMAPQAFGKELDDLESLVQAHSYLMRNEPKVIREVIKRKINTLARCKNHVESSGVPQYLQRVAALRHQIGQFRLQFDIGESEESEAIEVLGEIIQYMVSELSSNSERVAPGEVTCDSLISRGTDALLAKDDGRRKIDVLRMVARSRAPDLDAIGGEVLSLLTSCTLLAHCDCWPQPFRKECKSRKTTIITDIQLLRRS